ncbi:hypothetical protein Tco_1371057 [Tanacetum coccineum]
MNRALMFKWVWRFKSDNTSLWANFIKAMHGKDDLLGKSIKSLFPSIWLDIIRDLANLKNQGIDLLGLFMKKIGNGLDTSFWEDTWKGDIAFKFLYPRIYALESCKKINVATKMAHDNLGFSLRRTPRSGVELTQFNDMSNSLVGFQLPNMKDRWSGLCRAQNHTESSSHIFFACSMARDIHHNIASWWDVNPPQVASFEEWEVWGRSV